MVDLAGGFPPRMSGFARKNRSRDALQAFSRLSEPPSYDEFGLLWHWLRAHVTPFPILNRLRHDFYHAA